MNIANIYVASFGIRRRLFRVVYIDLFRTTYFVSRSSVRRELPDVTSGCYLLGRPVSVVPAAIASATSLATFASRAGLDHRGDQEAKDSDGDERLHVGVKALTCSGKLRSHFRRSLRFIGYSNCAFKRLSHHAECSPKIVANLRRKVGWRVSVISMEFGNSSRRGM